MPIYVDQMFNTAGEDTAVTGMNGGLGTAISTYSPKLNGKLLKVIIQLGGEAATSLVEQVRVELECTLWKPNRMRFIAQGSGLRTAPAVQLLPFEYVVDQEVKTDSPITGEYLHASGVPVTSRVLVYGVFQTNA